MLTKKSSLILVVGASVALALSGCGGGSSGGGTRPTTDGGVTNPTMTPPATRTQTLLDQVTAANTANAMGRAAEAQPRAGSVTQSSNVDSSNITTDQVEITVRYTQDREILEVRNGTTWSIDTDEGNARQIPDVTPPWYGAELSKRIEGGVLYVDLYSDIEDPTEVTTGGTYAFTFPGIQVGGQYVSQGSNITLPAVLDGVNGRANCTGCSFVYTTGQLQMTAGSMTFTPSDGSAASTLTAGTVTSTMPDADYLAGGVWLIVPDDATSASDYVFGAFADGSDPFLQNNLMAVTGTATYEGDATGVYSGTEAGSTTIGYFDGEVELIADFGGGNDLGAISGSITDFVVDGTPDDGTLNLGSANIGSQDSGFFKGLISGSDGERNYTGHWGGQFFGNGETDGKPGSVAGTFGGHSTDDAINFVGAFGAHKKQ
jgi:hypothetical protein